MKQRQLIGVVVASVVVAAGAAVAALNWPAGGRAGAWATPPPIKSQLRTIDLAPADPKAKSVDLPERGTATFGMLGITWTDPKAVPPGTMQVRTRAIATGAWSAWRSLDAGEGPGRLEATTRVTLAGDVLLHETLRVDPATWAEDAYVALAPGHRAIGTIALLGARADGGELAGPGSLRRASGAGSADVDAALAADWETFAGPLLG